MRLKSRLRTVSVGLLGDKERCGMCQDGMVDVSKR